MAIHRAQLYSSARMRLCSLPRGEAEQMVRDGLARRISRAKEKRLVIQLVERNSHFQLIEDKGSIATGPTLTFSDVFANAMGRAKILPRKRGVKVWDDFSGFRRRRIGNRVDQAMTKFEMWPFVGDTKAVRVGPRA